MSKQRVFVPRNIVNLMSPEDRKRLGVYTSEEERIRANLVCEREIHDQFGKWLYKKGFEDCYHSDPVRRPTIKAGLPDFGVYRDSRIIWIEFKVHPNKLTPVQEQCFERMGRNGNIIMVCHDSPEAERIVSKFFNLPHSGESSRPPGESAPVTRHGESRATHGP
jgi:hypothetical protein